MNGRDVAASLLMVAMVLLVLGALLAYLPDQIAPPVPNQDQCVQVPLSDRGMPGCDGAGGGRNG